MGNNNLFALDIGTRKIVGLVMQKNDTSYNVMATEMIEHSTRAMIDGQIHDVEAVAATIKKIKTRLEEKLQIKLTSAVVAAAGRALKTTFGSARKERNLLNEINREEVRALELEAVQQAQYLLAQEEKGSRDKSNYFCVGYSVISYQLENQEIASLVGQVGAHIAVQVVATFLPRVVVDSLFSSLKRADLDIFSLTLEPIAALSIAIPPNMRLLNLALIDIGAGTSDIAIVKNGNIFGYAMVPSGGDKFTEIISAQYLLDFNQAEVIKRLLDSQEEVEMEDILGNKSLVASAEIQNILQPAIEELGNNIVANISALNQQPPDAVVCIGGGSLTPALTSVLAQKLNLPANRVGIRTPASFSLIKLDADYLQGPQGVTPLGIAYYSFTIPPLPFIKVSVNGRELALWNMGDINVASALLSSGIVLNNIYGKPGLGKTVEVNGYIRVIKGEMGTPPVIKVNEEEATLETKLKEGDQISFVAGQDGKDASITARGLIPPMNGHVYVNGEKVHLYPLVRVNGDLFDPDMELKDRARIEFKTINNMENILELAGVSHDLLQGRPYTYYLNGQEMFLKWMPVKVFISGKETGLYEEIEFGSEIYYTIEHMRPRIRDVLNEVGGMELEVSVNGQEITITSQSAAVFMNGHPVDLDKEIINQASITWDQNESTAILSDIFNIIEIKPPLSGRLVIKVDGEPGGFTTPIYNHSQIELIWEE